MAKRQLCYLLYLTLLAASVMCCHSHERKVHVVYMGQKPEGDNSVASMHHSMLKSVLGSATSAKESLIYSYGRSFNGFAAKLSDEEAARFSDMKGVVSVLPNTLLKLHTTRSWDFMGFTRSYVGDSQGGDLIIGLLDTGIWPELDSFSDESYGTPPAKWKGICQTENNFTCNNKIIGARYYHSEDDYYDTDIKSPRDSEGHGTHTASTAAGREVAGASYYGLAEGLARGGAPNARIAVYKVCWKNGCALADILAAFDDAIADGVDIISVSIGSTFPVPYFEDPIAVGSFHAVKYGILTSNSAGNDGPWRGWVSNYSPWSLTVAASSIDRKFVSQLVLGNGQIFTGTVINSFDLNGTTYPLIWGGDATNFSANSISLSSRDCLPGDLDSRKVKGKIVLCEFLWDGSGVIMAEGLGIIMPTEYFNDVAYSFPLPTTLLRREDIDKVLEYIKSTKNPIATILVGEIWNDTIAPAVVSFSSRGPNPITPDILKPDLTAPGVDILAAWSPIAPPSVYYDTRSVKFNIISGTSMSCPHASGAAAFVKATHPSWSPAAIKSALMTTAYVMDPRKQDDKEFAYGSGHINPVRALDPGLVFDASKADYINFLCKQGYNTTTLRLVTGNDSVCNITKPGRAWDLNYPSFSLAIEDGQNITGMFTRTVTNVGSPNSTYYASMSMPSPLEVKVEPSVLSFSTIGEMKSFTVQVSGPEITQEPIISGAIIWKDGFHEVRTPLVVYTVLPSAISSHTSPSVPTKKSTLKGSSMYRKDGILK